MTISEYPVPPYDAQDHEKFSRAIAQAARLLSHGKTNNVIDVTLAVSATVTTISDARIGATTWPILIPTNTSANAIPLPFLPDTSRVNGSFILQHDSNPATKTYKMILIG